MADLGLCRVPVGTHSAASDYHRTAYGVIHISPPWGDLCTIEKGKLKREKGILKSEKWKLKNEKWRPPIIIQTLLTPHEEKCRVGGADTLILRAWGMLPCWLIWGGVSPTRMGMVTVTPHCTPSVFSVGLLRLRASGTLSDGQCYPTLHTFVV